MLFFAIITGYTLGTVFAFLLSRWVMEALARRYTTRPEQARFMKVMGGVLGAIVLAPAVFLSVIGGGYVERNYPALEKAYSELSVASQALIPLAGLTVVTAITVTLAVAAGAAVGIVLARSLYPDRRPN